MLQQSKGHCDFDRDDQMYSFWTIKQNASKVGREQDQDLLLELLLLSQGQMSVKPIYGMLMFPALLELCHIVAIAKHPAIVVCPS